MGAIEQQMWFAGDVAVIGGGPSEPVQRITGKNGNIRFSIPMEGTTDKIDGLVYAMGSRIQVLSFHRKQQHRRYIFRRYIWNRRSYWVKS